MVLERGIPLTFEAFGQEEELTRTRQPHQSLPLVATRASRWVDLRSEEFGWKRGGQPREGRPSKQSLRSLRLYYWVGFVSHIFSRAMRS